MFTSSNAFFPVERPILQTIQLDNHPSVICVAHTYPVEMPPQSKFTAHPNTATPFTVSCNKNVFKYPSLIIILLILPTICLAIRQCCTPTRTSSGPAARTNVPGRGLLANKVPTRPLSLATRTAAVVRLRAEEMLRADVVQTAGAVAVGAALALRAVSQSISPHSPFCTCSPSHTFEHREQR